MSSPRASTDSERDLGIEYAIESIKLKTKAGNTRIQVTYNDGNREIVKDPGDSKFGKLLLSQEGSALERVAARASLRKFSRFLEHQQVEVSHGRKCWNLYCSGLDCGINAPNGLLFAPSNDIEYYGTITTSEDQHGNYHVHFTLPMYHDGKLSNRIKLRNRSQYLIAGVCNGSTPYNNNVASRSRPPCSCEQCTEEGLSRDLEEAVINPLEILSQRYPSTLVAGLGIWRSTYRALVCRDRDGTQRIRGYVSPDTYSDFICECCKSVGKITRCGNSCMEMFCGSNDGSDIDIVEQGSSAVPGTILEFCPLRFKKLRKALRRVTEKLEVFGVRQGGPVLSSIARFVGATRAEVVFVLNNDMSLEQPIISGSNSFLRRDERGRWDSCDSLTGSELNTQVFYIDPTGTWRMIGSGEKYGVSSTDAGIYHLDLGGDRMKYGAHLDNQLFG